MVSGTSGLTLENLGDKCIFENGRGHLITQMEKARRRIVPPTSRVSVPHSRALGHPWAKASSLMNEQTQPELDLYTPPSV